jgi:2-amino-4-hydroxy-6-hydroxymethyldihydropteridine diphosphokinase
MDTFVALGANLPGPGGTEPLQTCRLAAAALGGLLPGMRLVALSRWYRSPSDPPLPGAPGFVNGVARLDWSDAAGTEADPAALLAALHRLEAAFGRVRGLPNAPRTLDLDLIAVGGMVRSAPGPVLPHPRAHLRRFVLRPLADVAPAGWRHPVLGQGVEALLDALPPGPEAVPIADPL